MRVVRWFRHVRRRVASVATTDVLLLETGDKMLMETGDALLIERAD